MTDISRRGFLRGSAAAGGALCLSISLPGIGCGGAQERMIRRADKTGELAPNMYITVLATGRIALAVNKTEIGQGVTTGYATMVAEELEVNVADVDFFFADSHAHYRTSTADGVPMWKAHLTGGSSSTKEAYIPLRRAAASAREMLIAAAARSWKVSRKSCVAEAGHVVHRSSGRKAAYGTLTKKAAREDVPSKPRLKKPSEFRLIGKRTQRVDAVAKVRGTAKFGIDVKVPNMVCAHVLHAPTYGGQAKSINEGGARKIKGVIDIFAFSGGVAIVADKYWQALRAARHVRVDWKPGRTKGLHTAALQRAARAYNKSGAVVRNDSNVAAALRSSGAKVVSATYQAPYLAHAPMEPQNCTVSISKGKAEVWVPSQIPTVVQEAVAEAIGMSVDDVLVHTTYCGGGFGRRGAGDFATQAALIAKKVKRPVKMIWSRESDTTQGFFRPAATGFFRGAVRNKRASALHYHNLSQPIFEHQVEVARGGMPSWVPHLWRHMMTKATIAVANSASLVELFSTEGVRDTPYRIPNIRVEHTPISTGMSVGFWRSVGHSFNSFFVESFVDELAHAAGADPYKFRRQMLKPGSRELRVLDSVAKLGEWGKPARKGFVKGIARHESFGTEVAEIAEVGVVDGRIRVSRVWCVVECGVAINPDVVVAQMESGIIFGISAALDQQITMVNGQVQQSNFDDYPALRMHESPEIFVKVLPSTAHPTGVGEPGLPPIAPAIGNALFTKTGVRLRELPMQQAWDARGKKS